MYTDTITLFNRKSGKTGDTWYPSVLHNAHLNVSKATIIAKYGTDSKDSAVLNIRYKQDGENKLVGEKLWLPPKQWSAQATPENALTFTGGTQFDFFWWGEWPNELPVFDDDYAADGDFYTFMNRTQDLVFAVSSVEGPYSMIPHFEILGK